MRQAKIVGSSREDVKKRFQDSGKRVLKIRTLRKASGTSDGFYRVLFEDE